MFPATLMTNRSPGPVEDELGRHARIGTSEDDRERLLARRQLAAARRARESIAADVRHESEVALAPPFESRSRGDHRRFILVRGLK